VLVTTSERPVLERRDKMKLYYEANKDKLRSQRKQYREANKEKIREYHLGEEAKKKKAAYMTSYYSQHKNQIFVKRKDYLLRNRDKVAKYTKAHNHRMKEYVQKNSEEIRVRFHPSP
jgi:hypothetical protein